MTRRCTKALTHTIGWHTCETVDPVAKSVALHEAMHDLFDEITQKMVRSTGNVFMVHLDTYQVNRRTNIKTMDC